MLNKDSKMTSESAKEKETGQFPISQIDSQSKSSSKANGTHAHIYCKTSFNLFV